MSLRLSVREAKVLFDRLNRAGIQQAKSTRDVPFPGVRRDSRAEAMFDLQLKALDIRGHVRNHRFCPGRKFELDFAWVEWKIAVEIQGAVHRIRDKFARDTEKMFLEHLHGWRVIRATKDDVVSGRAAAWLTAFVEGHRE